MAKEPEKLPPIPRSICKRCKRTKGDQRAMSREPGTCTRVPTDEQSFIALECEFIATRQELKDVQQRETALILDVERRTMNAIAELINSLTASGLDKGLKQFITRAIKRGEHRKHLES